MPSKQWKYFFIEDYQLPPYPQSIKIVPHTLERKIAIYWLSPATSELDIKSVRVYRRSNIGDDWKLLGSESEMGGDVDVNENMFVDDLIKSDPDDVELKIKSGNASYIYALTAVDVHGLESFMSIQTQVQLNSKFNIEKQEKKLKFISGGGTRIDETSLILNKLGKQEEIVIAKQKVTLSVSDTFADKQKDFIVKITNLDTHETKEVKLSAINTVAQPHYG